MKLWYETDSLKEQQMISDWRGQGHWERHRKTPKGVKVWVPIKGTLGRHLWEV